MSMVVCAYARYQWIPIPIVNSAGSATTLIIEQTLRRKFSWADQHHEMVDWCRENCKKKFTIKRKFRAEIQIDFVSDEDAALFKLFWV